VRAHLDVRGELLLPIHWGTFNLAPHPWEEPAERTVTAARALGTTVGVPRPGAPFEPVDPPALQLWWRAVAATPKHGEPLAPEPVAAAVRAHDDEVPA
jgi:hypothetical protein